MKRRLKKLKKKLEIFYLKRTLRLGKVTLAVRDTGVSRHNGGLIEGAPCTPQYISDVIVRGVLGEDFTRSPMMLRDASLSDSCTSDRCSVSSLDVCIYIASRAIFILLLPNIL